MSAGQHLGEDPLDAYGAGDGFGGALIVAGDHGDLESTFFERGDCVCRCALEGVADAQRAQQLPVGGNGNDSAGLALQAADLVTQWRQVDAGLGEEVGGCRPRQASR